MTVDLQQDLVVNWPFSSVSFSIDLKLSGIDLGYVAIQEKAMYVFLRTNHVITVPERPHFRRANILIHIFIIGKTHTFVDINKLAVVT